MRLPLLALSLALPVAGQDAAARTAGFTFPEFHQGDGRQKLGEFAGETVLVATFFDGFNGTGFASAARKLHEKHGGEGLVVVLAVHPLPRAAGAPEVTPGAWALHAGIEPGVRVCDLPKQAPWSWNGDPPYYAVVGPDGAVVAAGNFNDSPKKLETAVQTALRMGSKGWGAGEQAAVRASCARGDLAKARAKAEACGLSAEVDAHFERRCGTVRWLLADGQWQRAKQQADDLAAAAKDVDSWAGTVAALGAEFSSEAAKAELDLDGKLERLLRPLAKGRPDAQAARRLRDFAQKHEGSKVAARAARLAALVEQAATLR